ncbi:hypothetical protein BDC45DRAFT_535658 [Circinella umbellata]|nr:hypothetical protein BDC45DRAFT_535658 [Circinella umbellata]
MATSTKNILKVRFRKIRPTLLVVHCCTHHPLFRGISYTVRFLRPVADPINIQQTASSRVTGLLVVANLLDSSTQSPSLEAYPSQSGLHDFFMIVQIFDRLLAAAWQDLPAHWTALYSMYRAPKPPLLQEGRPSFTIRFILAIQIFDRLLVTV